MMTSNEIIELFKNKPRHAGRILDSCDQIKSSQGSTISEKAYNYCYPGSAEFYSGCLNCKRPFNNFISFNQGYRPYCSPKCSASSPTVKQTRVDRMIKKYGVGNPMQVKEIRESAQRTNILKYGSITPLQQPYVQEKVKLGLIRNYGVDHAFKIKSVKHDARTNKIKNYGLVGWEERLKLIETHCSVTLAEPVRSYKGPYESYNWTHKCGTTYPSQVLSGSILSCPNCKNLFRSVGEDELAVFIQSNTNIIKNDRETVKPYELDVYCPSLNLAIEYNGLYWHSDEWKKSDYHLKKLIACNKKGIRLIQIFEDEWQSKRNIIEKRLLVALGKVTDRIFARQCIVKNVPTIEATEFLNNNHLQGSCGSSIKLGLYYKEQLVALMTFGKPRFNKEFNWELLRFCSSKLVVGGASKLLSSFKKQYSGTFISYADRRWSNGNLYRQLGMTELVPSPPSYSYIIGGARINRVSAQKHKLKDLLGDKFDSNLSERQNMKLAGYHRIYDCGNHVFVGNCK